MNKKRPTVDDIKTRTINGDDEHFQLYLAILLGTIMTIVIVLGICFGTYIIITQN